MYVKCKLRRIRRLYFCTCVKRERGRVNKEIQINIMGDEYDENVLRVIIVEIGQKCSC